MDHNHKNTPKDVFSHLLAIITLYVGVISVIALLFQYINVTFPDKLDFFYTGILDTIRRSVAAIVVVWPVYILMSWIIGRDMRQFKEKRDIRIRRWLLYLTLFIAAITIIVDLITLVNNFLGGELTITFSLKVASVLLISSAVFIYYLWDLRRKDDVDSRIPKQMAIVTSCVLVGAAVAGFFVVGSPGTQRARRFDERRISDLQIIQSEIVNYWSQKENLPENLDGLKNSISGFTPPTDPETGEAYEYVVTDELSFDLCAIFKTNNVSNKPSKFYRPVAPPYARDFYDPYQQNWSHGTDRVCFTRTIDPQLYGKNSVKEGQD